MKLQATELTFYYRNLTFHDAQVTKRHIRTAQVMQIKIAKNVVQQATSNLRPQAASRVFQSRS